MRRVTFGSGGRGGGKGGPREELNPSRQRAQLATTSSLRSRLMGVPRAN